MHELLGTKIQKKNKREMKIGFYCLIRFNSELGIDDYKKTKISTPKMLRSLKSKHWIINIYMYIYNFIDTNEKQIVFFPFDLSVPVSELDW